jgi:hypothetical protein
MAYGVKTTLRRFFIRNLRGLGYFEVFMVTAVASILGIRLFLELTGFPQVGGSTLHIAHAVWGGLLMAGSIVMLLIFLGKGTETLAAMAGGAGFGLFIDEVGKFVTQSNDYFFQPSVALIYVTLVAFYLLVRYVFVSASISELEYLVNAIREMQHIPGGRLMENERREVLYYLEQGDQQNPLIKDLEKLLGSTYAAPGEPSLYRRWKSRVYRRYKSIAHSRWFTVLVVVFFVIELLGGISNMIAFMFSPAGLSEQVRQLTFSDWAILGSNVVSGIFIAWGLAILYHNRLRAYLMFERSVLVAIFIGQLFLFYKDELGALGGLVFNLVLYVGLHFLIERERDEMFEQAVASTPTPVGMVAPQV